MSDTTPAPKSTTIPKSKKTLFHCFSEQWQAAWVAAQFLTILPVPSLPQPSNDQSYQRIQGLSVLWYPAIGLLLGMLLWFTAALLLNSLAFPPYLTAAILVGMGAVLTGALHLDGLADCADAWVGGLGDTEKTLQLLKDPRCGAMAVVAVVMVLAIKTAALTALLYTPHWGLLLVVPLFARSALLLLFLSTHYARANGLGAVLAQQFERHSDLDDVLDDAQSSQGNHSSQGAPCRLFAKGLLLVISVVSFLLFPWQLALCSIGAVVVTTYWVRHMAMRRLSGFTGDVAGALVELCELSMLLAICGWAC